MKRKPDFKNGIFHGKPIYVLAVILLTVLLVISILTAVTIGSVDLSVKDVYSVILYKVFGIGDPEVYGVGAMSDIVWFIRLPRILLATAVGMGLAVAGVVMQAIVKIRSQIRIFLVFPLVHLLVQQWQSSWSWSRIWLQLYWNLRIYRSLPYFCTGTDHCKYRRPGKFGPTSACRYSTWKCVQCIFKLCCLYCGRQRWNPDSYFLADGKSGRREMGKSGCDYSLRFYSNPVFLHPEPYSQYDAAWR